MRLLIATGGSSHSEAALRLGGYLLQAHPDALTPTLITVIRREADRPKTVRILNRAAELLGRRPEALPFEIRSGQPAQAIIDLAQAGSYDLVLVGERPRHRLWRRLWGSAGLRVMEQVSCPVIVAKGTIRPIRRILLCDSGAESPSLLEHFTAALPDLAAEPVQVTVLHVMSQISAGPGVRGRQLRATARELIHHQTPEGKLLAQDLEILAEPALRPRPKVRHGFVVGEILSEACEGDYDLVVIGAHRGEGWQRFLLDNLAYQIITQIDRPVLVLR